MPYKQGFIQHHMQILLILLHIICTTSIAKDNTQHFIGLTPKKAKQYNHIKRYRYWFYVFTQGYNVQDALNISTIVTKLDICFDL